MPVTPTLILRDQLVADLKSRWNPSAPSGVEAIYFPRITDEVEAQDLAKSFTLEKGERRVFVMAVDYDSVYENHEEDRYTHEILALVLERYTDDGDPPVKWIDDRVDFTFTYVVQGFDYRTAPSWNANLRTIAAEVDGILAPEKMFSGGKLFFSLIAFTFEENRTA